MDLSKAFDCIVHDLLLAKLSAYGFDYNSLKLINSFLSGRKFRTKIGSSYSPYLDLLVGVPQGSILGPLLFNIYMCDLFLCDCETNIINYADDTYLCLRTKYGPCIALKDIFEAKSNYYNTRNAPVRKIKKVRYGLQIISYIAPKIWNLLPKEMKQVTTLNEFKTKIEIWNLENCPCRLCTTYLPQIGFIT